MFYKVFLWKLSEGGGGRGKVGGKPQRGGGGRKGGSQPHRLSQLRSNRLTVHKSTEYKTIGKIHVKRRI